MFQNGWNKVSPECLGILHIAHALLLLKSETDFFFKSHKLKVVYPVLLQNSRI